MAGITAPSRWIGKLAHRMRRYAQNPYPTFRGKQLCQVLETAASVGLIKAWLRLNIRCVSPYSGATYCYTALMVLRSSRRSFR